jgi:hypothetical protein
MMLPYLWNQSISKSVSRTTWLNKFLADDIEDIAVQVLNGKKFETLATQISIL